MFNRSKRTLSVIGERGLRFSFPLLVMQKMHEMNSKADMIEREKLMVQEKFEQSLANMLKHHDHILLQKQNTLASRRDDLGKQLNALMKEREIKQNNKKTDLTEMELKERQMQDSFARTKAGLEAAAKEKVSRIKKLESLIQELDENKFHQIQGKENDISELHMHVQLLKEKSKTLEL